MPFVILLALAGLGFYIAKTRTGAAPPEPPLDFATRDANGVLGGTKDGSTLAMLRLLRYAPAARIVGGAPLLALGENMATTKKTFLGTIGAPGQPPLKIQDTAVGWVQDRCLEGKYVFLRADLFQRDTPPAGLPAATTLLAVDPTMPPSPRTQLAPIMGPGAGWVLLGDPAYLADKASEWPESVADFVATG